MQQVMDAFLLYSIVTTMYYLAFELPSIEQVAFDSVVCAVFFLEI
jgi:hypothetical protein